MNKIDHIAETLNCLLLGEILNYDLTAPGYTVKAGQKFTKTRIYKLACHASEMKLVSCEALHIAERLNASIVQSEFTYYILSPVECSKGLTLENLKEKLEQISDEIMQSGEEASTGRNLADNAIMAINKHLNK